MENKEIKPVQSVSFKSEILRKMIHISSSVIPVCYFFLDKNVVLSVLVPLVFLMLLVEVLKYKVDFVYNLYTKFFKHLLRDHEYDRKKIRMNGATWLLLAEVICIIVFPKLIAITGMLLLSLSDSTSAIIGRLYGKKQFAPNRSYAGSVTFFIVGTVIILSMPKYIYAPAEYFIGMAAVLLTTIVDAANFPTDDNFSIPLVSSALIYVLYLIFLPAIF